VSETTPSFNQTDYRATMGEFCTGVVIVTGIWEGEPAGFAVQSFVSLSLEPPLIALCPAKTSTSWPKLRAAGHFCINMLDAQQEALCSRFARSGGDKFADLAWRAGVSGAPILDGVLAYVDCELHDEVEAGDHTIAIGQVLDFQRAAGDSGPLLFFRGTYGEFSPVG